MTAATSAGGLRTDGRQEARSLFGAATVVVIDDVADNVVLLKRLLEHAGVNALHGFTDAVEALRRLPALDPDLLLLDLHMPGVDGFAVLDQVTSMRPAGTFLPVLVLTADASPETRRRALEQGATDFLTKPVDVDEALLRSRNLLETRALYRRLRAHNAQLVQQLEEATARERDAAAKRERVTSRLRDLLNHGGPTMVFQPIQDLRTGALAGVEALARFTPKSPEPSTWFQDAAFVGLEVELELAAVAAATAQLHHLPRDVFMTFNASFTTSCSGALHTLLAGLPRRRLVLEVTEHSPVEDYVHLSQAVRPHREAGLRLAIDDTGAGYASLRHLLQLQPDVIKLDIGLTRGIDLDPARRALAVALRSFADEIDAVVLAEGIETDGELRTLRELGIPLGQGYLLGRPAPLAS